MKVTWFQFGSCIFQRIAREQESWPAFADKNLIKTQLLSNVIPQQQQKMKILNLKGSVNSESLIIL